jgi:hypothetical protein
MKKARTALLIVLLSLVGLKVPAQAQWNPAATASMGQMMGGTNLMVGNLSLGRAALQRQSRQSAGHRPTGGITFNASPAVTAEFKT